ncbi:MAG: CHAT domain-containing protein [Chitinophagaceae bacterium]
MNTIVIEILRNGQVLNQLLQKQTNYIALCGAEPATDFTINCDQAEFDDHVKLLRYDNNDEDSRQLGIQFFQQLINKIIEQIYPKGVSADLEFDLLHLRLVTTPKEIAQLPFEMALTPLKLQKDQLAKPFFLNPDRRTTFTREVRQVGAEHYNWPFKPRILFAWAQPRNEVPWEEHLNAFINILRPWAFPLKSSVEPVPDLMSLITVLENASTGSIASAVIKAVEDGNPYTHVHLLAHGSKNADPAGEQFLLVLNSDDNNFSFFRAQGSDVAKALIAGKDGRHCTPQVVSLIACDSGNVGSPVNPAGSLAHYLHHAGIPCVFASQFPLTQNGSVKLVTSLYTQLLESSDPRLALFDTRASLDGDKIHDWASLVAYARFPEDIDEQMKDIRLKIMLEFMKTSNALADHVLEHMNEIDSNKVEKYFDEVDKRLGSSIDNFTSLVEKTKSRKHKRERYAEHYGLIGSAYKRKAEHIYRVAVFRKNSEEPVFDDAVLALKTAMEWYCRAYSEYLYSHWNGTQYLSLATLFNDPPCGEDQQDIWTLCRIMAVRDEKEAENDWARAWSYGTLAELFMLRPFIFIEANQKGSMETALLQTRQYLKKLTTLQDLPKFVKESTTRQFRRYVEWWPNMIHTSNSAALKTMASTALEELA